MKKQTIQDKVEAEWKKKLQEMAYPLWEQNFEKEIQGMNDR